MMKHLPILFKQKNMKKCWTYGKNSRMRWFIFKYFYLIWFLQKSLINVVTCDVKFSVRWAILLLVNFNIGSC